MLGCFGRTCVGPDGNEIPTPEAIVAELNRLSYLLSDSATRVNKLDFEVSMLHREVAREQGLRYNIVAVLDSHAVKCKQGRDLDAESRASTSTTGGVA